MHVELDEEIIPSKTLADKIINNYLTFVDKLYFVANKLIESSLKFNVTPPTAIFLTKLTLAGLFVVFVVVLCSCVTPVPGGRFGTRPQGFRGNAIPAKEADKLYIKRETIKIKPSESGSKSGSIFADAKQQRTLFLQDRPNNPGDIVTITIPEELQFRWNAVAGGNIDTKMSDKTKGSSNKNSSSPSQADQLNLTDPSKAGNSSLLSYDPVKKFNMEVIALEPTGDLYLRGVRNFENSLGEKRAIMIMAKVPKRSISDFEIPAESLTAIQISEEGSAQASEYTASGWDVSVSRRLSGFVPDIGAELAALDDVRKELAVAQSSLNDRSKALAEEKERLKKDRDRMSSMTQGINMGDQTGQGKNGQNMGQSAGQLNQTPPLNNIQVTPAPTGGKGN